MDKITAIEAQKRRGNRRSIYVNGEFVAGVDQEVVLDLGLKVGQQVDGEKLAEVLRAEEFRKAREAALTLLDYRARTRKELERRLIQKGYSEDVVAQVIAQLEKIDLVNDERFAADWVASRVTGRPMGRSRMNWELRRKGIAPESVEEALQQVDEEREFEMALELAERKLGGTRPSDPDAKRRLASFLQRRGFYWEIVSRVLDRVSEPEEEE
ncbi:MAG TPA: regulatory protein RecX [Armatimonadota bacterium]|jgi:regulatory protein|nr:regulatory protein RecX [Armatimonadota bacterium]HOM70775.1 regulatory protein RecX [Armatimonadota bacterium]HPP73907.1 regulatory protein RecX [Armatimonadota bacterium]